MAAPGAEAITVGATDYVDDDTLQTIVLVCSILSVVGTTAMGVCFVFIERLRAYPARLTFYLGLSNWFWFVSILSGIVDVDSRSDTVCKYAGPLNQVFGLTSIFWTCCIALHMALIIAKDNPPSPQWEWRYHAFVWATPIALVIILLVTLRHSSPDYLRSDSAVCYVASDHAYLRFITQSGPSILGFVFNIVAYSFAWWKARRTAQRHEYDGADPLVVARHKAVVQRVLSSGSKYLIVYIVSWAPSVGQDIALLTSDSIDNLKGLLWLVYLSQAIFFLQGLSNTIVYVWSKWHVFAAVWQSRKTARRVSDIGTALLRPGRTTRQDSMFDSEYHMDADDYMPQQYYSEDSAAGYSYAQRVASRRMSDASMPSFDYPDQDSGAFGSAGGGGLAATRPQASGPRSAPYMPPFQPVPRATSAINNAGPRTDRVATLRSGRRPQSGGSGFHGSARSRSGELGTSARSASVSVLGHSNPGSYDPPQITRGARATSNSSQHRDSQLFSSMPGARSFEDTSNAGF